MMKNIKIPADWKVKKVSELGKVVTGSTPSMSDKSNYNGNFPWVTAQDFKGKYIYDSVIKLSDKGKSKSRIIPAGSVLVTCIASIGLNAIAGVNMATNQQINSIIPNENTNREFLYYLIDNNVNYLKIFAGAGGMLILSKSEFEKIKFAVPPLKEQEKIAEILSAWDKVIELLDRKIDLKSQQKKYLMQILLTGDIRLSGFNAPWNEVKLGDICKIKKGEQLSKLDMFEFAKYPVLNGGQDFSGYTDKFNAKKNTIAISEGGNSCGFVSYVISDFWSGGHCYTIETKINKLFSYYILKFNEVNIMRLRVGSGLPNIQKSTLEKFKIKIPTYIKEQEKIAEILTLVDDEISLLQKKRELIKQQKKYLMQTLLTGQIRVSV